MRALGSLLWGGWIQIFQGSWPMATSIFRASHPQVRITSPMWWRQEFQSNSLPSYFWIVMHAAVRCPAARQFPLNLHFKIGPIYILPPLFPKGAIRSLAPRDIPHSSTDYCSITHCCRPSIYSKPRYSVSSHQTGLWHKHRQFSSRGLSSSSSSPGSSGGSGVPWLQKLVWWTWNCFVTSELSLTPQSPEQHLWYLTEELSPLALFSS